MHTIAAAGLAQCHGVKALNGLRVIPDFVALCDCCWCDGVLSGFAEGRARLLHLTSKRR
jgi:hypothetical protein